MCINNKLIAYYTIDKDYWISNIAGNIPKNWVLNNDCIDYNSILKQNKLKEFKKKKNYED